MQFAFIGEMRFGRNGMSCAQKKPPSKNLAGVSRWVFVRLQRSQEAEWVGLLPGPNAKLDNSAKPRSGAWLGSGSE